MKMKMKMHNRSHSNDTSRLKTRHGNKYTKHENRMMMLN